jgi:cellulose synthase/poly-beta-1,6-N-acetylglucosamine synthase-like glycosyltransferase
MDALFNILFWGCFGILIYIYAGYILALLLLVRIRPVRHEVDESHAPMVSIIFSARNESDSLPKKMASIRQLNYPKDKLQVLVASDASTDGTNEYLAAQDDIHYVEMQEHGGKNAALNMLMPQAQGEVLFFTDANTIFHPDCIKNSARHFSDPKTGAVVGELIFTQGDDWNAVGSGAGLYWKYENIIKRCESQLGSLLVGGGALLAARRDLVNKLDPRIANDLEIPTRSGAQGFNVLYEPNCLGYEKAHTSIFDEIGRTSRIVSRGLRGFVVLLPVLLAAPMRFWQFISHKFLRWFTLAYAIGALVGAWGLRSQTFPAAIFYLGIIILLSSIAGLVVLPLAPSSRKLRPFTLLAHMLIMHIAALWGICKTIFGRTPATWTIPESTRKKS